MRFLLIMIQGRLKKSLWTVSTHFVSYLSSELKVGPGGLAIAVLCFVNESGKVRSVLGTSCSPGNIANVSIS
jgi:hypothetical protein